MTDPITPTPDAAPASEAAPAAPPPQADVGARLDAIIARLEQQGTALASLMVAAPAAPAAPPPEDDGTDPQVRALSTRIDQLAAVQNQQLAVQDVTEAERMLAACGATTAERAAVQANLARLRADPAAQARGLTSAAFAVTYTLGQARLSQGAAGVANAARQAANAAVVTETSAGARPPPAAGPDLKTLRFNVRDPASLTAAMQAAEAALPQDAEGRRLFFPPTE